MNLGLRTIEAGECQRPRGPWDYNNSTTINGGYLRGTGKHIASGGTFVGTTNNADDFSQTGTTTFTSVTNNRNVVNTASSTLNWTGGANGTGGSLTVDGTANVKTWTNRGKHHNRRRRYAQQHKARGIRA